MSEEADSLRDSGHSHAAAWGFAVSAVILLYVLSPPPLAWMYERFGWDTPDWPQYVFAPIIILYNRFEPVKDFYDGYSELLGVDL